MVSFGRFVNLKNAGYAEAMAPLTLKTFFYEYLREYSASVRSERSSEQVLDKAVPDCSLNNKGLELDIVEVAIVFDVVLGQSIECFFLYLLIGSSKRLPFERTIRQTENGVAKELHGIVDGAVVRSLCSGQMVLLCHSLQCDFLDVPPLGVQGLLEAFNNGVFVGDLGSEALQFFFALRMTCLDLGQLFLGQRTVVFGRSLGRRLSIQCPVSAGNQ